MQKKETDLSSFNNSWYKNDASVFANIGWYFINAAFFKSAFPINAVKIALLKLFGAKMGKGIVVKPHVNIKYPWRLQVADNVWIGEHVWIDNLADVVIEENVCISKGALLLCGNHDYRKTT